MKNIFTLFFLFFACIFFTFFFFFSKKEGDHAHAYTYTHIAQRWGAPASKSTTSSGYGDRSAPATPAPLSNSSSGNTTPCALPGGGMVSGCVPGGGYGGSAGSAPARICIGNECRPVIDLKPSSGNPCFGKKTGCRSSWAGFTVKNTTAGGKKFCIGNECIVDFSVPDQDADGVFDISDNCPNTPSTPIPERPVDENGCSQHQVDSDMDGVCNSGKTSKLCSGSDNCQDTLNADQKNTDSDTWGDACDTDDDNDGVADDSDTCPTVSQGGVTNNSGCPAPSISSDLSFPNGSTIKTLNPGDSFTLQWNMQYAYPQVYLDPVGWQTAVNGTYTSTISNYQAGTTLKYYFLYYRIPGGENVGKSRTVLIHVTTPDKDSDGFSDTSDNCPDNYNPSQENTDGDSLGDACDTDDDGDGVADTSDSCRTISQGGTTNNNGCPAPSATISSSATTVNSGGSYTIQWSTQYANSWAQVFGGWVENTQGSRSFTATDTQAGTTISYNLYYYYYPGGYAGVKTATVYVTAPDRDGDGFSDIDDYCPDVYGTEQADKGCPTPRITGWKGEYDSYPRVQCTWKGGARNYFEVTIDSYWTYAIQYTDGNTSLASGTCNDSSGRCWGAKYNNNGVGLSPGYPRRIRITAGSKARSNATVVSTLCDVPDRENSYNRQPYGWYHDGYVSDPDSYSDTCDSNRTSYYTCPDSCSGYACSRGFTNTCVDVGGKTCNNWGCSGAYVANVTCYEKFNHNPPE